MKVGLLCGREDSFPPAFIDRVNTLGRDHGITAEFVTLTARRAAIRGCRRAISVSSRAQALL